MSTLHQLTRLLLKLLPLIGINLFYLPQKPPSLLISKLHYTLYSLIFTFMANFKSTKLCWSNTFSPTRTWLKSELTAVTVTVSVLTQKTGLLWALIEKDSNKVANCLVLENTLAR